MKYQKIDLKDYSRTGEGATAVAYTHKTEPRLTKLYNKGFEADEALRDFRIARTVYDMGLPSPQPYRLVTDGEKLGAEYEYAPAHAPLRGSLQGAARHESRHFGPSVLPGNDTLFLRRRAVRIPFMLNMAYRRPVSEGLARFVTDMINAAIAL